MEDDEMVEVSIYLGRGCTLCNVSQRASALYCNFILVQANPLIAESGACMKKIDKLNQSC